MGGPDFEQFRPACNGPAWWLYQVCCKQGRPHQICYDMFLCNRIRCNSRVLPLMRMIKDDPTRLTRCQNPWCRRWSLGLPISIVESSAWKEKIGRRKNCDLRTGREGHGTWSYSYQSQLLMQSVSAYGHHCYQACPHIERPNRLKISVG